MIVQVKDLKPNPFRDLDRYEVDSYKVDALVTSIKETSFWDNILARSVDGKYEIAYGHHRLFAIQKVGLKEIDIPVRDLDDPKMLQIMCQENLDEWKLNPAVIKESVRVTKEYLDGELEKYENWEDLKMSDKSIIHFDNRKAFSNAKKKNEEGELIDGVGRKTIHKFLGGNWKEHMVQEALTQLKESKEMQEATEAFETQTDAQEFRKTAKKFKIPKSKVKTVAKKVAKNIKEKKEEMKKGKKRNKKGKKAGSARGHGHRKDMKTFTRMAVEGMSEKEARLEDMEQEIEKFDTKIRAAYLGTLDLNQLVKDLDVKKIEGLKSLFVLENIADLLQEVREMLIFFGFDYKTIIGREEIEK